MTLPVRVRSLVYAPLVVAWGLLVVAASAAPPPGASTPLRDVIFTVVDTETTGLKASEGRVLEIGAVKFTVDQVLEKRSWLINPGIPIPLAAQRINGITDTMVSNCPPFAAVFGEFAAFAQGSILLAHNARFDRRFLAAELARNGMASPTLALLDTLPLYRRWFQKQSSYALEPLTRALLPVTPHGAPPPSPSPDRTQRFHAALWDAECTAALCMRGLTNYPGTATLADLQQDARKILTLGNPPP